jgi:hypothetical protein
MMFPCLPCVRIRKAAAIRCRSSGIEEKKAYSWNIAGVFRINHW